MLRASAHAVGERYPSVSVLAIVGDFERHLVALPEGESRLVAFLGSTIGNLYPRRRARLLATVGSVLVPGDAFLLGVDLVKDPARIEAAYNDPGGVTEAFVRNGLVALNRELRATFDQARLSFEARWDPEYEWMDIGFHEIPARASCARARRRRPRRRRLVDRRRRRIRGRAGEPKVSARGGSPLVTRSGGASVVLSIELRMPSSSIAERSPVPGSLRGKSSAIIFSAKAMWR